MQTVKDLKNKQVANIVLLGALIETRKIVSREALEKAIQTHKSERFRSLNLKALQMGMDLGRGIHG
jgi:Pyruvate/2-oxoacid:ferredoxin oxidoreductase gamma subunit